MGVGLIENEMLNRRNLLHGALGVVGSCFLSKTPALKLSELFIVQDLYLFDKDNFVVSSSWEGVKRGVFQKTSLTIEDNVSLLSDEALLIDSLVCDGPSPPRVALDTLTDKQLRCGFWIYSTDGYTFGCRLVDVV